MNQTIKNNYLSTKNFSKPKYFWYKISYYRTSKNCIQITQDYKKAEKINSNSSLYSDTKKSEKILIEKDLKITKRAHAFKGYGSIYIVVILNSFNPELQLKDTESASKSKLIELLAQLRGFKFVTTLVLVFKKIESKNKTEYGNFYSSSKAEATTNKSDIVNVFQSAYTAIIENIRKSSWKDLGWIIDSVIDPTISISSIIFYLEAVI